MINQIKNILNSTSGYKTYVVGVVMIILGILQDMNKELILEGLGLMTLRAGVKKIQN